MVATRKHDRLVAAGSVLTGGTLIGGGAMLLYAYEAALQSAEDDHQRVAAQRAAATALSEHINASLLEPPLVE